MIIISGIRFIDHILISEVKMLIVDLGHVLLYGARHSLPFIECRI